MKFSIETEDKDLIHALASTLVLSFTPQAVGLAAPLTPYIPKSRGSISIMDGLGRLFKNGEIPLTPKAQDTIARLKKQGQYAGLVRHLPSRAKVKVKEAYKVFGINSAIGLAEELAHKTDAPMTKPNGHARHRAKCALCGQGFLAKRRKSKHCSKRCRDAAYRIKKACAK
jgi:hypothetical protein